MDPLTRDTPERPARDRELAPYGYCRYCGAPRNQGARFCGGLECVRLGDADRAAAIAVQPAVLVAVPVGEPEPTVGELAQPVGKPEPPEAGEAAAGFVGAGTSPEQSTHTRLTEGWLLVAPIQDGSTAVAPPPVVERGWEQLAPLEPRPERPAAADLDGVRPVVVRRRRGARRDAESRMRLVRDTSVLLIIGSLAAYLVLSLLPVGSHPEGGVLGATSVPRATATQAPVGLPGIVPAVGSPPSR